MSSIRSSRASTAGAFVASAHGPSQRASRNIESTRAVYATAPRREPGHEHAGEPAAAAAGRAASDPAFVVVGVVGVGVRAAIAPRRDAELARPDRRRAWTE